ncbi:amidase signature domain-containing protein [Thelonectria olida]|uniref:Amidase signature domain-containing protein n=1 Tax=Thelonectria olida TaxID=1576542 RepID=A0A9P8W238_9HYPO|nr:amidase signature domain-containing protein [Thelonectria olida]
MPSKTLPVVQPVPVLSGPPEFETLRTSILEEFAEKVPENLRLPQSIFENPPKNVTAVPRECGLLSADEIEITEKYDATELAASISSKKLTAVAVATAFAKRAIISHQVTCCLMEWFMDEAIERAKALDEHLEKTGKTVGPLHGVPISVKEHMPLAGHWTTVGYMDTRRKDTEDCQMMAILRKAGAVFYCKTIQPQSIMHLESVSVYGRVLNPYNIGLSAGGSTGGEAALVAMRGSVLGVGTDIGGSVRGPSGFCGIYGFKPTSYTLPMKDFLVGGFGAELNVLCSTGPMCASLRDMDLFMSVMAAAKPYLTDPRLIPIPWTGLKSTPKPGPLKVGFMMDDGAIAPQPPVISALHWAKQQLEASGDFLVKIFNPFRGAEAMKNIRLAYWPDGGKALKKHLEATKEPMFPLTQWIIKDAEGTELTSEGVLQQRVTRDTFRCDFAEHWESQDVDIVICPVFVGPACEHDKAFYWNYTAFWNYVDYPGVVVPTPVKAQAKGVESYAGDTPLSEECKHVRKMWNDGDFEGAPVNLQVVARKYHDNDLFAALDRMKEALQI